MNAGHIKKSEGNTCQNCQTKNCPMINSLPLAIMPELNQAKIQNHYKKGQSIHLQGTPLYGVSAIESGMVKLVKSMDNGDDIIINLSSKGDIFGLRCLLSNKTTFATVSVIAVEDTTVCFYDKFFIKEQFRKYPQLALNILSKLDVYMERDEVRILSLSKKSVRERVAETLINLEDNYGAQSLQNSKRLPLQLKRNELSSLAGTANETFIRTLSEFQKEGLVKLKGSMIEVIDRKALHYCSGAIA